MNDDGRLFNFYLEPSGEDGLYKAHIRDDANNRFNIGPAGLRTCLELAAELIELSITHKENQ